MNEYIKLRIHRVLVVLVDIAYFLIDSLIDLLVY